MEGYGNPQPPPPTMGFEKQRQKLVSSPLKWGDQFPAVKLGCDQPMIAETRAKTTFHSPTLTASYDARASKLDALIQNGMHAKSVISPQITLPSTKGWTISSLLNKSKNFLPIKRTSASSRSLAKSIEDHEARGEPLVIEGWHKHSNWHRANFTLNGFSEASGEDICVRNIHDWSDRKIPLSDFLAKSRTAPQFAAPDETERLYGKDAECPLEWKTWLRDGDTIPQALLADGPGDLFRYRPKTEPVETLMCYVGVGDTFTPCHKDLCGSSGQNLMCYTENDGSSFWFMAESSNAPQVAEYFQDLKQEIDHESHVITIDELSRAPFKVYITEQKLGDLVLVPPRSCHQVVNYGGITIKTSWSRMTWKGLSTAYYHELPIYRRVCRPETYRIKSTIYYTLLGQTKELSDLVDRRRSLGSSSSLSGSISRSVRSATTECSTLESRHEPASGSNSHHSVEGQLFDRLFETLLLYDSIISDEYSPLSSHVAPELLANERIICDFCGADVFQSFFECRKCTAGQPGSDESYVVCAGCFVEGRSCKCLIMEPMQCRPFEELLGVHDQTVEVLRTSSSEKEEAGRLQTIKSRSTILNDRHSGTFRAACVLLRKRKLMKNPKVCTITSRHESSHTLPFASVLTCKGCHSAKCFSHTLVHQRIHSAEALLFHELDGTPGSYHRYHMNGKKRFEEGLPKLQASQREGSRPDLQLQCVDAALKYGTCRPINSTFMSLGWYDVIAYINRATERLEILQADEIPVKASAPIIHPSSKSSSRGENGSTSIERRPNLAFVLIPPAPYTIPDRSDFSSVTKATPQIPKARPDLQIQSVVSLLDPVTGTPPTSSLERTGKRKADDDALHPSPSIQPAKIRRKSCVARGDTNTVTENPTLPPAVPVAIDVNSAIDSMMFGGDLHSYGGVRTSHAQSSAAPGNSKGSRPRKKALPHETVKKRLTRSASALKKTAVQSGGAQQFPSLLADAMNSANSDNAQTSTKSPRLRRPANYSTLFPRTSSRITRNKDKEMMMEVEPSPEPLEPNTSDVPDNQPITQLAATASLFHPEGSESDVSSDTLTSTAMHNTKAGTAAQQPRRSPALESRLSDAVHAPPAFQQTSTYTALQLSEKQDEYFPRSPVNAIDIQPAGPATPVLAPNPSAQTCICPAFHGTLTPSGSCKCFEGLLRFISSLVQLAQPEAQENSHAEYLRRSSPGPSWRPPNYSSLSNHYQDYSSRQQYFRGRGRGPASGRTPYPQMGTNSIAGYGNHRPFNGSNPGSKSFYVTPNRKRFSKASYPERDSSSRRSRWQSEEQGAQRRLQRQVWDREPDSTTLKGDVTQIQPHPSNRGNRFHNSMEQGRPWRGTQHPISLPGRQPGRQTGRQRGYSPDVTQTQSRPSVRDHRLHSAVDQGHRHDAQNPTPLRGFQVRRRTDGQRRCFSETPQSGGPSSTSNNTLMQRFAPDVSLQNQSGRNDRTPDVDASRRLPPGDIENEDITSNIEVLRETSPHRSEVEDPQDWERNYVIADESHQPTYVCHSPIGQGTNMNEASVFQPVSSPNRPYRPSSPIHSRAQTPEDLTYNAWASPRR